MRTPAFLITTLISTTALALPPGAAPHLHGGANHHIGDDSFVAKFGRRPNANDPEGVRMTTHLQHVHDWLASRPATRPELAKRRAQILAALEQYIAKGTTPRNLDLPWRTPVFIDEEGTICAVGYLIESTVGRELPETIAKHHRYDFIEDIARDMPEVQQWIADSGLTLEEIQTIQPAYEEPEVREWRSWDLVKFRPKDGPSTRYGRGNFKSAHMDGEWKMLAGETVVGRGVMHRGRGAWTSFYPTGEKLAEGRYAGDQPEGAWRLFHRSGNLAAEGAFDHGTRVGKWQFYFDTPGKTPMAVGRFAGDGSVAGTWHHYDSDGKLLARSWTETPSQWEDDSYDVNGGEGSVLDVVPGSDGIHHVIHQGTPGHDVEMNELSLEAFSHAGEYLYISRAFGVETWYGADGAKLVHGDGGWTGTDCHWSELRKTIAKAGDVARLDGVLSNAALHRARGAQSEKYSELVDGGPACHGEVAISRARAERLDALLASRDRVRAATPKMVRDLILDQEDDAATPEAEAAPDPERDDLAHLLAAHMAMYIEWPHVDRRFKQVYATMPGRYAKHWASRSETDGDPSLADNDR